MSPGPSLSSAPAAGTLAGVFGSFPVLAVQRIVRRTLVSAAAAGIIVSGAAALLGAPLIAPGVLIGLAMAVANHRVFQLSAVRYIDPEGTVHRRPFAGSVLVRLGACTGVAVVLLLFVRAMGFGVILGLALFQAAMLVNALVALIGYQRQAADGGTPGA